MLLDARSRALAPTDPPVPAVDRLPALAGATALLVGLQIAYPLSGGAARGHLTIAIVAVFAAGCALHAGRTRGPLRAELVLAVTAIPGFLVEVIGVRTGVPFGSYHYTDVAGTRLFGVPLVVGLAWTMVSWPAALAARRLATRPLSRILLGAWAMTAGDLFLDPQMVATRVWTWDDPTPHLPWMPTVPLTNFGGWLLVTLLLSAAVQGVMGDGGDAWGVGIYLWSWLAWAVALGVFLHQPAAALWGLVAMGTVAVPLALRLAAGRAPRRDAAPVAPRTMWGSPRG